MIFLINNWQETHQNTNSRGIIRDLFPFLCFSSMHSKTTSVSPHTLGGGLVTQFYPTLVIPWTVTCQAPLSIRFSRQEYRSGLPFPSPEDLPDSGIEPRSPALQVGKDFILKVGSRESPNPLKTRNHINGIQT